MTARDELVSALEDGGHLDANADRLIAARDAEVLREAADELDEQLGGVSLASIALRRMAAEATAPPICGTPFYTAVCRLAPHSEDTPHLSPDGDPATATTAYQWADTDAVGRTVPWTRTAVA